MASKEVQEAVQKDIQQGISNMVSQDDSWEKLIAACEKFLDEFKKGSIAEIRSNLTGKKQKRVTQEFNNFLAKYNLKKSQLKRDAIAKLDVSPKDAIEIMDELHRDYYKQNQFGDDDGKGGKEDYAFQGLYKSIYELTKALNEYLKRRIQLSLVNDQGQVLLMKETDVEKLYSSIKTSSKVSTQFKKKFKDQGVIIGLDLLNDKKNPIPEFQKIKSRIETRAKSRQKYYQVILARGQTKTAYIFKPYYYQAGEKRYSSKNLNRGHYAEEYVNWIFNGYEDNDELPRLISNNRRGKDEKEETSPYTDQNEEILGEFINNTKKDNISAAAKGDVVIEALKQQQLAVKSTTSSFNLEGWRQYVVLAQKLINLNANQKKIEQEVDYQIIDDIVKEGIKSISNTVAQEAQQGVKNK